MSPILTAILVVGTLLFLVTTVIAIRAGVSAFLTQARLRREVLSEVERLSRRAGELESRASRLENRVQELPVKIARMQESLADLRVLSANLYITLSQLRRMLSYSGMKYSGTSWLSGVIRRRARYGRG